MPLDWTDGALMVPAGCLPCCTPPAPTPIACSCALILPPLLTPYVDYNTAAGVITNYVASCQLYAIEGGGGTGQLDTYTINVSANIAISLSSATLQRGLGWIGLSLKSGDTVTVAATVTTDGTNPARPAFINATLYECDGTQSATDSDAGTETGVTGTLSLAVPADGEYFLLFEGGGAGDATSFSYSSTISFSDTYNVNPVIAQWDDGGTTRNLWACPKLLIPPLTEDTGTWYANSTAAASAITNQTSNCKGYIASTTNVATFTATDGGTSLTLANTLTAGATSSPIMWGGLNAVNAATITVTGTVGTGTPSINVGIYDDAGVLVESSGVVASPWTSAALPYKGRYTVSIAVTSSANTTSMSGAITSSGTISVNTVQARYDVGLVCAALDDC